MHHDAGCVCGKLSLLLPCLPSRQVTSVFILPALCWQIGKYWNSSTCHGIPLGNLRNLVLPMDWNKNYTPLRHRLWDIKNIPMLKSQYHCYGQCYLQAKVRPESCHTVSSFTLRSWKTSSSVTWHFKTWQFPLKASHSHWLLFQVSIHKCSVPADLPAVFISAQPSHTTLFRVTRQIHPTKVLNHLFPDSFSTSGDYTALNLLPRSKHLPPSPTQQLLILS